MDELDPLVRAGEDDAVLADHGAAAQAREADVAGFARAGVPVAHAHGMGAEFDVAPGRRGLAQEQRGA